MSSTTFDRLVAPLREAVVNAAWTQWGAIGFGAAARTEAGSLVDPEALVLASLAFGSAEPRLRHVIEMLIGASSRMFSVGRLANLLQDYPVPDTLGVASFAALAATGGDARWRVLTKRRRAGAQLRVAEPVRRPAVRATPDLRQPATLLLRLRLGFGVGIKADVLGFLLGHGRAGVTIRGLAEGTRYYERAVRRAVEDLVAARLVETRATSPASYHVEPAHWERLLGVTEGGMPLWRWWHELYVSAYVLCVWAEQADAERWTSYVAASRLRDVFERLDRLLLRALVRERPDWGRPPEEWLEDLPRWLVAFVERLKAFT